MDGDDGRPLLWPSASREQGRERRARSYAAIDAHVQRVDTVQGPSHVRESVQEKAVRLTCTACVESARSKKHEIVMQRLSLVQVGGGRRGACACCGHRMAPGERAIALYCTTAIPAPEEG